MLLQDRVQTRRATHRSGNERIVRRDAAERYFALREPRRPIVILRQMSDRAVSKMVFGAIRHSVSHPESIDVAVDQRTCNSSR